MTKFLHKIALLESVAGGASNGKSWWSDHDSSKGDLMAHFKNTLDRVNVESIVNRVKDLESSREGYAISRAAGPEQDTLLERCAKAMLVARTTNLEVILMKIITKSKHPSDRILAAMANFSTDESMSSRFCAEDCLAQPVKDYMVAGGFWKPSEPPTASVAAIAGA